MQLSLPLPNSLVLLEETQLMTVEKTAIIKAAGTRLEILERDNLVTTLTDSIGNTYCVGTTDPFSFSAIPANRTCLLSEFKQYYEMPKIVRFIDFDVDDFVKNDQGDKHIMSDVLSGPVRILEENEYDVVIVWITDNRKTNGNVQCLLIPESKTKDILAERINDELYTEYRKSFENCCFDNLLQGKLYLKDLDEQKISHIYISVGKERYSESDAGEDNMAYKLLPDDNLYFCPKDEDIDDLNVSMDNLDKRCTDAEGAYTNFPSLKARFEGISLENKILDGPIEAKSSDNSVFEEISNVSEVHVNVKTNHTYFGSNSQSKKEEIPEINSQQKSDQYNFDWCIAATDW